MIGMQYEITLSNDFDMDSIRKRVKENGYKTNGFEDLFLKVYLIGCEDNHKNYSPLYLWKNQKGMNKFIFDGFYDNILGSFGWQNINVGIPFLVNFTKDSLNSNFVKRIDHKIKKTTKMEHLSFSLEEKDCIGKVLIYNPDKWQYSEFYFYENKPKKYSDRIYEILHISTEKASGN